MATKLKHVTYLNASPAPHTWRTLQAQGFKPLQFRTQRRFSGLEFGRRQRVSEIIPDDLPERDMLLATIAPGAASAWSARRTASLSPFVFKPRRLDRPPVPMMELIYCRATADFARCGAALGRHFLKRGVPGLHPGRQGRRHAVALCRRQGAALLQRSLHAPQLNDLAYTEKVIFG